MDFKNLASGLWASQRKAHSVKLVVRSLPADTGDLKEASSIPGSGRSPEEGLAAHGRILAWRVPWTEEPDALPRPWGCIELGVTKVT